MKIFNFLNHASIRCDYNGLTLVTDPWYISNAFGSWYQEPSPLKSDIYQLIDSDEKIGFVISHGHDDHLDDWFIKHHLSDKSFFVPKFATPGLENRLRKKLGVNTTLIQEGIHFGDFKISQYVNPDFTEYDAVIIIKTPSFLIIHANDNYHSWPEKMMNDILQECNGYDQDNIYLLIQFGIADCFPINYLDIKTDEVRSIIEQRFENYLTATESNMKNLGLSNMYYYANQSKFEYKFHQLDNYSMYDLAQQFLKKNKVGHTQLMPGMTVSSNHNVKQRENFSEDLFNYCLKGMENFFNKSFTQLHSDDSLFKFRFKVSGDTSSSKDINFIADRNIWNRIIFGELTIESIIIGGSGAIIKPAPDISDYFFFAMKYGYIAQNRILVSGLSFYKEQYHEI